MASKDHHRDIDFNIALCKEIDSQLNHLIESLGRKIMEFGAKREGVENMKKMLNEISMQFNDCKNKVEAQILSKRLDELIAEYFKIEGSIGFDVGGPSQEEFNQYGKDMLDMASGSTESKKESKETKKQDGVEKRFLDNIPKSDSSDGPELPVSTDNVRISANILGLRQFLTDASRHLQEDKK